jgi:hypothetical protein
VNPQVLAAIIGAVALIAGIVLKWMLDTKGENSRLAAELASQPATEGRGLDGVVGTHH